MCNCAITPNFPRCVDGSRGPCRLGHGVEALRDTTITVEALCALASYGGPEAEARCAEAVKLARREAS